MSIVSKYLRFDGRSLGLFRIGMGIVLLFDLFHRWDWIRAFYSNLGILANHNHLFQLKDEGRAWSVYHSFSSVEEAWFAFLITFFIYLFFTVGFKARAMHAVSIVCLVGLSARNTVAEGPGNSVAIALMLVTFFLPLGDRLSIDSLRRSLREVDEHSGDELNDRASPSVSPPLASLAAVGTLLLLALILIGGARAQNGETWRDGTALYYALHVDRWTSSLGVAIRETTGLLSGWTHAFRYAALLVIPLALVPVARHITRPIAAALLAFVGLTIGLFFSFGLYGWSLVAAALLLIPEETWQSAKGKRPTTMIYDDDCGICLLGARIFKRLDISENLTFQENSAELPEGVTAEMVERSMIAIDSKGTIHSEAAAVAAIIRPLPIIGWFSWIIVLPGIHTVLRWLYFKVADNRTEISVQWGLGACGIPDPNADDEPNDEATPISPAQRMSLLARATVASLGALMVVMCCWAQSEVKGTAPATLGLGARPMLVHAASWARVHAPWGLWTPDPPRENGAVVVVAKTRGDYVVDVLTGYPPNETLSDPHLANRGPLWAAYTSNIAKEEFEPFRKEFRRYLSKGGYALDTKVGNNYVRELKAYWVTVPTPPPGSPKAEAPEVTKRDFLNMKGGGRRKRPRRPKFPLPPGK